MTLCSTARPVQRKTYNNYTEYCTDFKRHFVVKPIYNRRQHRSLYDTQFAGSEQILSFLLRLGSGAKYCDPRVCMYVCMSVCLFVCLSACPLAYLKNHTSKFYQIFCTYYLLAVARSSSDDNAMLYVMYFRFCG